MLSPTTFDHNKSYLLLQSTFSIQAGNLRGLNYMQVISII